MEFSIVKLFPDNLVQALGDTLLHSLWQGLILSVITAVIIVSTRKSSPGRRYNLLIAALVIFAAGTVATFVISLEHAPVRSGAAVNFNKGVAAAALQAPVAAYHETVILKTDFKDAVISYFNRNSATIVLIWFMIVCARSLQLATGLQGVYYLRRRSLFKADELWQDRVYRLARDLGISRAVKIAESGLAKVPMVIGHLKPLILIPVGLLTSMPVVEIEAILIHELAHIRRSDYLVNLLQSLLEIIFFFNPAVLWISSLIKTERENCCDDIAVSQSSSKVNYIKALVACQEYNRQPFASLAMALNGQDTPLKTRVTRIISNNNQSLNRMEKGLLAICLVTAGLCTAAFTNAEKINKLVANTAKAVTNAGSVIKKEILPENKPAKVKDLKTTAPADTITKSKLKVYRTNEVGDHTSVTFQNGAYTTRLYKEKGILYQLNYRHNVLVSMQVDSKAVPTDKIVDYQPVIDQLPHETGNETANAGNSEYREITDEADRKKAAADASNSGNNNSLGLLQTTLDSMKIKFKSNDSRVSGILRSGASGQEKLNELKSLAIADSVNGIYKKGQGYDGKWTKSAAPYAPKYPVAAKSVKYAPYITLKDDDRRDLMIGELLKDGIITTKDNLSFKISTSEFIVNGKKLPDDVYRKYSKKFVKPYGKGQGEWSWLYNYDTDAKRESNTVVDKNNN